MLREALRYLMEDMSKVNVITADDGEQYADRPLHRISYNPKADPIRLSTLTSLVDYLQTEKESLKENLFIHVISPTEISVYTELDSERKREYLVRVKAELPSIFFDSYCEQELFCIGLQSKFVENEDRKLLLKFAGSVEHGTVEKYVDDGFSQKATVKTGITSKAEAIVPSPVMLKPYRTFLEVEQPESAFVFRMRNRSGVECALFEADGGAWRMEAMQHVADYLADRLKDKPLLRIIV